MRIHNINLSRSSRDNIFIYRNHAYTWYFDFFLHLCGILFLIKCPGLQYGFLWELHTDSVWRQNDIEPFLSKINWYWCMPIKVYFLTECSFFTSFTIFLSKITLFFFLNRRVIEHETTKCVTLNIYLRKIKQFSCIFACIFYLKKRQLLPTNKSIYDNREWWL